MTAVQMAFFGSSDFRRRMSSELAEARPEASSVSAELAASFSSILEHRPRAAVFEIGHRCDESRCSELRTALERVRERFGDGIFVAVALLSPERLYFGGDLLFVGDGLAGSGLVDTFLAHPPGGWPGIASLGEQCANVIELLEHDSQRRAAGGAPLPALASDGWAQSLADPLSRQLWMRWLPRYAGYTNENPLVTGESGTGKSNLALALHKLSGRPGQFVNMTPRDFSSAELVQSELFGSVSGAFTGAVERWGLVKSAEGGSLFIDELQSIDKDLQGKLITFIENKIYRRVGSPERVTADVRFIFAANRSLKDMMNSEILRHDFAYRLERVQLELKPLRQRRLDVTAAIAFSLAKVKRLRPGGRPITGVSPGAHRMLFGSAWPGNSRQLENAVAQLAELAEMDGSVVIEERHVIDVLEASLAEAPPSASEVIASAALALSREAVSEGIGTLDEAAERLVEISRAYALDSARGDARAAATLIGDDPAALELFSRKEGR